MKDNQTVKNKDTKIRFTNAVKDLFILAAVTIFIFILSYFFNVFIFLVRFFQKSPSALTWIGEIITGLLSLSIGFAIISVRRLRELKKETSERIRLQEKIITDCIIKEETEKIICKQLHYDIEDYKKRLKKIEKDVISHHLKQEEQFK